LPRVEGARAEVCVPGTAVRVAAEEPTLLIGGVRFGVFGVAASVLGLTVRFGVLGSGPGRLLPGPGRLLGGPGGALAVALTATLLPALLSLTLDPVPPGPTLTCVLGLAGGLVGPTLAVALGGRVPGVGPHGAGPAPKPLRGFVVGARGSGLTCTDTGHASLVAGRGGASPGVHDRLGRFAQHQREHGPGKGELEHRSPPAHRG